MISRLLCMVPQYVGMLQYQKILKRTQFVGWRAKNVIFMAPNRTLAHTPAQQHPVLLPVHLTFCSWSGHPALTLHTYTTPATHVQNDGRDTLGQTISVTQFILAFHCWGKNRALFLLAWIVRDIYFSNHGRSSADLPILGNHGRFIGRSPYPILEGQICHPFCVNKPSC